MIVSNRHRIAGWRTSALLDGGSVFHVSAGPDRPGRPERRGETTWPRYWPGNPAGRGLVTQVRRCRIPAAVPATGTLDMLAIYRRLLSARGLDQFARRTAAEAAHAYRIRRGGGRHPQVTAG